MAEKRSHLDMYLHHLAELQKVDKDIEVILDTTKEEIDWIKNVEEKK